MPTRAVSEREQRLALIERVARRSRRGSGTRASRWRTARAGKATQTLIEGLLRAGLRRDGPAALGDARC